MNPWLARHLIYHPVLSLRGESVKALIDEVKAFHSLEASEMEKQQWEKLRSILQYAFDYNPYYRALFDRHGINPADISTPEDFRKVPYLTKRIIQTENEHLYSRDRQRVSRRKTSGSTGMPIRFVKDRRATAYMNAVMHEVYHWHGIEIGDRQGRIWGMPLDFKHRLVAGFRDILLNRKKLVSFDISEKTCRRFYNTVKKFKPKFLYGLPCSIVEFTRILQNIYLDPAAMDLEIILSTGETLTPKRRAYLEKAYRCPVLNEYGATECGIIAFPCRDNGLHLMSSNLYVEVIDPDTNQPAKPGEPGEVVLTELHSHAMPFIRYRIGDIVVADNNSCSCGMELPVISEVRGRVGEIILTPENKKVAMALLDRAMEKYVQRFKVIQRAVDRLEVVIEKYPGYVPQHAENIKADWQPFLGDKMQIDIVLADRIPPDPSGKLTSFISDIIEDTEEVPG